MIDRYPLMRHLLHSFNKSTILAQEPDRTISSFWSVLKDNFSATVRAQLRLNALTLRTTQAKRTRQQQPQLLPHYKVKGRGSLVRLIFTPRPWYETERLLFVQKLVWPSLGYHIYSCHSISDRCDSGSISQGQIRQWPWPVVHQVVVE